MHQFLSDTKPKILLDSIRAGASANTKKAWGSTMKKMLLGCVWLAAIDMIDGAYAADTLPPAGKTWCDPYKNYSCLGSYLGDDFFTRLVNYYRLEWGHDGPPVDPKAPPSRRDYWPATPLATPPT